MPMPKLTVPRIEYKIRLPVTLGTKIDLLLMDPLTGKRKYGALNSLVERLLSEWVQSQVKEETA